MDTVIRHRGITTTNKVGGGGWGTNLLSLLSNHLFNCTTNLLSVPLLCSNPLFVRIVRENNKVHEDNIRENVKHNHRAFSNNKGGKGLGMLMSLNLSLFCHQFSYCVSSPPPPFHSNHTFLVKRSYGLWGWWEEDVTMETGQTKARMEVDGAWGGTSSYVPWQSRYVAVPLIMLFSFIYTMLWTSY